MTPSRPDEFIVISGGLVSNDPALPVLDMDVLDSDAPDAFTWTEVATLRSRIEELLAKLLASTETSSEGSTRTLTSLLLDCDRWLDDHADLRPDGSTT